MELIDLEFISLLMSRLFSLTNENENTNKNT